MKQENNPLCQCGMQSAPALTINPDCCSQLMTGLLLQKDKCQLVSGSGRALSWTLADVRHTQEMLV